VGAIESPGDGRVRRVAGRSEVRTRLATALRAAYKGRFTQSELAKRLGVAQNTVSRWATGDVEPGLADILAVERECGLVRGHILRAAGLVTEAMTPEEAIAADHRLDAPRRELLLAAYEAALVQSAR
jgi:transcriptional regulator with XRE-family HTH domain